jgi:Protein of unknown function (DUF2862)
MKVGQKVRVRNFRDGVGAAIAKRMGEVGVIQEFKILDGSKMGFIVGFSDSKTTWFFPEELEAVA